MLSRAPSKRNLRIMGKFWTLLVHLHSLAGPGLMLLYPLYASVVAIESPSKLDDQQWLAYWILYSFLTLMEMALQSVLEWLARTYYTEFMTVFFYSLCIFHIRVCSVSRIPIWYDMKLLFVAWLVLPQFKGAAFLYDRFVREKVRKYGKVGDGPKSPTGIKGKTKLMDFITTKKAS